MKIKVLFFLLTSSLLLANQPFGMPNTQPMGQGGSNAMEPKLSIHNEILAKINDKAISVMDVKKEMDMIFLKTYPDLVESPPARHQFYTASWKHVLDQMINKELMLLDAEEKQLQISEGEVREEMEKRFGPNIMKNLEKIGLTFEEAKENTKTELVVQRMSWYFIHQTATQAVTPKDVQIAYEKYLVDYPPKTEWTYQVISMRSDESKQAEELSNQVADLINKKQLSLSEIKDELLALPKENQTISISDDFVNNSEDISASHKQGLQDLVENQYSKPFEHSTRRANQKPCYRIFYLKKNMKYEPASFAEMSKQLRNELIQKLSQTESEKYISRLRKHYGFENNLLLVSEDFAPFSLQ